MKAGILAVVAAIIAIAYPFWIVLRFSEESASWRDLALRAAGAALLIVLPILAARWKPALASSQISWVRRGWSRLLWACALAGVTIVWAIGCAVLTIWLGLPRPYEITFPLHLPSPLMIALSGVFLVVVTPIAEEFFWRGYALDQFRKMMPGSLAVLLQAGLFSALHLRNAWASTVLMGHGLIWGWWRLRRGTLVPVIVAHMMVNGLSLGYVLYRQYQASQRQTDMTRLLEGGPDELKSFLKDVMDKYERAQKSPKGKEINALAQKHADQAVPGLMKYLTDEDEGIQSYAQVILMAQFRGQGLPYYVKELDSDNPRVVEHMINIISLIDGTMRIDTRDTAPKVHKVVMESTDFRVQVSGVAALMDWKDRTALEDIAANHPIEKTRQMAQRWLDRNSATTSREAGTSPSGDR